MQKVLICYIPTIHRGYVELFDQHKDAVLVILGESILKEFTEIIRDMRAVTPHEAALMLRSLCPTSPVGVVEIEDLPSWKFSTTIVMPDEEVSRAVAEKYLSDKDVHFESVFLRWDKKAMTALSKINPDHTVSKDTFHRTIMNKAYAEARRSSDWWRQVGGVAVRDGEILFLAHNKHTPSEQTPYLVGDPRSSFNAGEHIELSSALHGEVGIIALAANRGVSLKGADLYVTTFPCSGCARAIGPAGFRRVFYAEGYSQIEGEQSLRSFGIKIIRVDMTEPPS